MKIIYILLIFLACIANADRIAYQTAVITDTPVGYWKLDESSGASTALDSSGFGNHGVYSGVIFGQSDPFGGSSAVAFSVSYGSYINISDTGSSSLDVSYITMEAWVKPVNYDVSHDRGMVINKENTWEVGLQDGTGNMQSAVWTNTNTWAWRGSANVGLNGWSHIVLTYDGSKVRHYVNGILATDWYNYSGTLINNNEDMRIGARGGDGGVGSYFEGAISEVAIYNYALTESDIVQHYNSAFTPSQVPEFSSIALVSIAIGFFLRKNNARRIKK